MSVCARMRSCGHSFECVSESIPICGVATSTHIHVGAGVGGEVGAGEGAAVGDGVGLHAHTAPHIRAYALSSTADASRYKPAAAIKTMGAKCTAKQARVRSAPPVNATRDAGGRADCAHNAMRRACGSHLGVGDAVGAGVGEGVGEGEGDGLRIHRVRAQARPRSLTCSVARVHHACLCMRASAR